MESATEPERSTQETNETTPCACNFRVFSAEEKKRHSELMRKIDAAIVDTRELADGYGFHLQSEAITITDVAEWITYERHCCTFFHFEIELRPNHGSLWLNLRGGTEVKDFLRSDVERRTVFEPKE
jgi:hypothetical protein